MLSKHIIIAETANSKLGRIKTPNRGCKISKDINSAHRGQVEISDPMELDVEIDKEPQNQIQNDQIEDPIELEVLGDNQTASDGLDDTMPYDVQDMEFIESDNSDNPQV